MTEQPSYIPQGGISTLVGEDLLKALDNSFTGIISFEAIRNYENKIVDFSYRFVNKAAMKILQRRPEDFQNATLLQLYPGLDSSNLLKKYIEVVEKNIQFDSEERYQDATIDEWYRMVAIKSADGFVINFINITEQRRHLKKIEESEQLYRTMIHSLPHISVFVYNQDLEVTFHEGNLNDSFAINPSDVTHKSLPFLLEEKYRDQLLEIVKNTLSTGQAFRVQQVIKHKTFEIISQPLFGHHRKITGGMMVFRNIQFYKEVEQELERKIIELEKTNQNLEQFAYVASHDLQEPLRKIRAFGDRLLKKYSQSLEGEGGDYIVRMQSAAERMQGLIDDLLRFSRVSKGANSFEEIHLSEVIQQVLHDLDYTISEKEASIEMQILGTLQADPLQIRQLFQNLISNALKFSRPSVKPIIKIKSRLVSGENVSLSYWPEARTQIKYREIKIIDNGIGFDNKYAERIFTIFQRLHGRSEFPGTGIGLAICKKIIENHYGYITAKGKPDQGATFIMVLPVKQSSL